MRIAKISGTSGYNAGDKLITHCTSFLLQRDGFECREVHINPGKKAFSAQRSVEDPSDGYFRRFYRKLKQLIFSRLNILVYAYQCAQVVLKHKPRFEHELRDCDLIIVGGGNLLFNGNGSHYLLTSAVLAKMFKGRIIFWGVGVGPFDYPFKRQIKIIGSCARKVVVRDLKSASYFDKATNIAVSFDPAFIASDLFPLIDDGVNSGYIGVNLMDLSLASNTLGRMQDLDETARNLYEIGRKKSLGIKFILTSVADNVVVNKVKGLLNGIDSTFSCVLANIDVSDGDIPDAIKDVEFVLCHRMHSSIISLSYCKKTLVFPWQQKVSSLMEEAFSKDAENYLARSPNFDPVEVMDKISHQMISQIEATVYGIKKRVYSDYNEIKREILQKG